MTQPVRLVDPLVVIANLLLYQTEVIPLDIRLCEMGLNHRGAHLLIPADQKHLDSIRREWADWFTCDQYRFQRGAAYDPAQVKAIFTERLPGDLQEILRVVLAEEMDNE